MIYDFNWFSGILFAWLFQFILFPVDVHLDVFVMTDIAAMDAHARICVWNVLPSLLACLGMDFQLEGTCLFYFTRYSQIAHRRGFSHKQWAPVLISPCPCGTWYCQTFTFLPIKLWARQWASSLEGSDMTDMKRCFLIVDLLITVEAEHMIIQLGGLSGLFSVVQWSI